MVCSSEPSVGLRSSLKLVSFSYFSFADNITGKYLTNLCVIITLSKNVRFTFLEFLVLFNTADISINCLNLFIPV